MDNTWLFWTPLLLIALGSGLTAAYGLLFPRALPFTRWSQLITLLPATAFGFVLAWASAVLQDGSLQWQAAWIPTLDLNLILYIDGLAVLFALLITGIGTLIVLYTSYYFSGDAEGWRFLTYLMLFMAAMLGVVIAGDIFTLFVAWEMTSITSYLLVAHKYKYPEARAGAFRALFITGGGGVALLGGLILMGFVGGTTNIPTLLGMGDVLQASPLYPIFFLLLFFGAATKSAQFPAHIWLPGAMSAPTPASAYLHSATMVKAGVYLLARFNPALGGTEWWFWTLTTIGLTTLVLGAFVGLKQNDLKGLLAYSTISQLGALVMLAGQDSEIAFKALVVGILAHALYKSALFLIVGTVDHSVGTRDLRHLGGLRALMPGSLVVTAVAALSMAGLPPLFGFLAKETLLATGLEPAATAYYPQLFTYLFPLAKVVAGALLLVQAALLTIETFFGTPNNDYKKFHAPHPMMWLIPGVPALFSLGLGILPESYALTKLMGLAAEAVYGAPVKVSFTLWMGFNIPLLLSVIAVTVGISLFATRGRWLAPLKARPGFQMNTVYVATLRGLDRAAYWATRLQYGSLRFYLGVMVLGMASLVVLMGGLRPVLDPSWQPILPDTPLADMEMALLRFFALVLIVVTSATAVLLRRDFPAILALGISGLGVAIVMILEPAPDVALVQVVVDILAVVVLVLALMRLPRTQRQRAEHVNEGVPWWQKGTAVFASLAGGMVMTILTWVALASRPRPSQMTPYYAENAKASVNSADMVGAIVVDFRALDTLLEIAVFGLAGLAVYSLLTHATKKWDDDQAAHTQRTAAPVPPPLPTRGIGGRPTSYLLQLGARLLLPLSLVLALTHIMYGHDQPGDGFTAGVIITLGLALWFVVFGTNSAESRRLGWVRPPTLLGAGLGLGIFTAVTTSLRTGHVFGHTRYLTATEFLWPTGFALSSSLLFELSIALTVIGSGLYMINTLAQLPSAEGKKRKK